MLGDGHGDAGDVGFLKSVGANQCSRNVPSNRQQRNAVQHGVCKARHQVGCAGAAGSKAHPNLTCGFGPALGSVGRALFVTAQDMAHLRVTGQRVVHRHDGSAGIAKQGCYPVLEQGLPQGVCAVLGVGMVCTHDAFSLYPSWVLSSARGFRCLLSAI